VIGNEFQWTNYPHGYGKRVCRKAGTTTVGKKDKGVGFFGSVFGTLSERIA
jgi:hypothetical protein